MSRTSYKEHMERVYSFGKMAFEVMMLKVNDWKNNKLSNNDVAAVSRFFYHMVRESGNLVTELTTDPDYGKNFRKIKYVDDHYYKPERVAKFLMTRLKDFKNKDGDPINEFFRFFNMTRSTIRMPKFQHDGFSKRTSDIITAESYQYELLTIYDYSGNEQKDQSLNIPNYYTEWERQYLNGDKPKLIEPLVSKRLTAVLPIDFQIDL